MVANNWGGDVIQSVTPQDVIRALVKKPRGKEKTRATRHNVKLFFSPPAINKLLRSKLKERGWNSQRLPEVNPALTTQLEVDFVKNGIMLEVQFGKYPYVQYDILDKFDIWRHNNPRNHFGIEVVFDDTPSPPTRADAPTTRSMKHWTNTGQGHMTQTKAVLDLCAPTNPLARVPTVVLGIRPTAQAWAGIKAKNASQP